MALRLAAVSESDELDDDLSVAADPRPCISYRDSIRSVAAITRSGLIKPALSFPSVSSTSTWSSSSYASNCSGVSAAGFRALIADDLRDIARRMVSDGYAQRMVQAFNAAAVGEGARALEAWFFELDVDWVLRIREGHGLLHVEEKEDESSLHDLVKRWIRALVVMVHCFIELGDGESTPTAFARTSIAKMVVFVDAVLAAPKVHYSLAEKLHAMVNMYGHAMDASSLLYLQWLIFHETESRFDDMEDALFRKATDLHDAISSTMEEAKTLVEPDDDSTWETEIARGRGEVHWNTRLMVDCIVSLGMYKGYLYPLIDDAIGYLKDLITRISNLCPDTSLRYMFLLNNSHFVVQQPDLQFSNLRWIRWQRGFTDGAGYIDSYFNASWEPVLSCLISKPSSPSPWRNKSSPLKNFVSAFHETYKSQKLWKVPSPELRGRLRKTVSERVVSGYKKYLEEHSELKELVSRRNSNTPADLEEMLGELFEG